MVGGEFVLTVELVEGVPPEASFAVDALLEVALSVLQPTPIVLASATTITLTCRDHPLQLLIQHLATSYHSSHGTRGSKNSG